MKTITIQLPLEEILSNAGDYVIRISKADVSAHINIVTEEETVTHLQDEMPAKGKDSISLFKYIHRRIEDVARNKRFRATEIYRVTLKSLSLFRQGKDLLFCEITPTFLSDYEGWLRERGLTKNTTSFYLRTLRSLYNNAASEGLTADTKPFSQVYTGIAKTRKRAVSIEVIKRMESLSIPEKRMALARDLFMFSFYTRGMSFVDIAYLKKSDLCDGQLTYRRQKTGQTLCVSWNEHMQAIVDRHPSSNIYLLPIIRRCNGKERNQYRHAQRWVNEELHELAKRLELVQPLTMYVARHSWASIARSIDIPVDIISQGMGHNSLRTTQVYLKEIDNGRIDEANSRVLDLLHEDQ